jgi:hypothetical protein
MKKKKMGDARSTYGERCAYTFWWENLRERDHLEDFGVHERIILKRT